MRISVVITKKSNCTIQPNNLKSVVEIRATRVFQKVRPVSSEDDSVVVRKLSCQVVLAVNLTKILRNTAELLFSLSYSTVFIPM